MVDRNGGQETATKRPVSLPTQGIAQPGGRGRGIELGVLGGSGAGH